MYTLLIIGVALVVAAVAVWLSTEEAVPANVLGGLSLLMLTLSIVSLGVSCANVPVGYTEVDSVSYMTEAGHIETLDEGDYYTDGTNYYKADPNKAYWVPFASVEYVKLELPGKVVSWESGDMDGNADTTQRCCANCGNELNVSDKSDCGCVCGQSTSKDGAERFCTNCGNKTNESDKFCAGCGTSLPDSADTAQQFCANCGKELNDAAKFCGGCGAVVANK